MGCAAWASPSPSCPPDQPWVADSVGPVGTTAPGCGQTGVSKACPVLRLRARHSRPRWTMTTGSLGDDEGLFTEQESAELLKVASASNATTHSIPPYRMARGRPARTGRRRCSHCVRCSSHSPPDWRWGPLPSGRRDAEQYRPTDSALDATGSPDGRHLPEHPVGRRGHWRSGLLIALGSAGGLPPAARTGQQARAGQRQHR
jgi:hypothetical protein